MNDNKCIFYCDGIQEVNDEKEMFAKTTFSSMEHRLFFIYGEINERTCSEIAYTIALINLEDEKKDNSKNSKRKPIRIFINSYGGSAYDMWILVDTIMSSTTPVYTYCCGYAMSAAFIVFLAGHRRFMSPHATLMYHQLNSCRTGKYQDLVDGREQADQFNKMLERYVVGQTTLSEEYLYEIREKKQDKYFTVEEAVKYCIVDEIFE